MVTYLGKIFSNEVELIHLPEVSSPGATIDLLLEKTNVMVRPNIPPEDLEDVVAYRSSHVVGYYRDDEGLVGSTSGCAMVLDSSTTIYLSSGSGYFNSNLDPITDVKELSMTNQLIKIATVLSCDIQDLVIKPISVNVFEVIVNNDIGIAPGLFHYINTATSINKIGIMLNGSELINLTSTIKSDVQSNIVGKHIDVVKIIGRGSTGKIRSLNPTEVYLITVDLASLNIDADLRLLLQHNRKVTTYGGVQDLVGALYEVAKNAREVSVSTISQAIAKLKVNSNTLYSGLRWSDDLTKEDAKGLVETIANTKKFVESVKTVIEDGELTVARTKAKESVYGKLIKDLDEINRAISASRAAQEISSGAAKAYIEQINKILDVQIRHGFSNSLCGTVRDLVDISGLNVKWNLERAKNMYDKNCPQGQHFYQSCDDWVILKYSSKVGKRAGDDTSKWLFSEHLNCPFSITKTEADLLHLNWQLRSINTADRQTYTSCGKEVVVITPVRQTPRIIVASADMGKAFEKLIKDLILANQEFERIRQDVEASLVELYAVRSKVIEDIAEIENEVFIANALIVQIAQNKRNLEYYHDLIELYHSGKLLPCELILSEDQNTGLSINQVRSLLRDIEHIDAYDIPNITPDNVKASLDNSGIIYRGTKLEEGWSNDIFTYYRTIDHMKVTHTLNFKPDSNGKIDVVFDLFHTNNDSWALALAHSIGINVEASSEDLRLIADKARDYFQSKNYALQVFLILYFAADRNILPLLLHSPKTLGDDSVMLNFKILELIARRYYGV